eukprot:2091114-Heterocapsa_arctica.AAC.1
METSAEGSSGTLCDSSRSSLSLVRFVAGEDCMLPSSVLRRLVTKHTWLLFENSLWNLPSWLDVHCQAAGRSKR